MRPAIDLMTIESQMESKFETRFVLVERGTGYCASVHISRDSFREDYLVTVTRNRTVGNEIRTFVGTSTLLADHTPEATMLAVGLAFGRMELFEQQDAQRRQQLPAVTPPALRSRAALDRIADAAEMFAAMVREETAKL